MAMGETEIAGIGHERRARRNFSGAGGAVRQVAAQIGKIADSGIGARLRRHAQGRGQQKPAGAEIGRAHV